MKYSDLVIDWLKDLGYTHCFFVGGGNIMHLLDSVRSRMVCVPVVHEVAAGIAVEGFNDARNGHHGRAFAMVTAGPGLTNIVTAFGGAYLESRELLVLGGQVKTTDLSHGSVRQRGLQEVDGVSIVRPLSNLARRFDAPVTRSQFAECVEAGRSLRKGPVFLEFPLDVQAIPVEAGDLNDDNQSVAQSRMHVLQENARSHSASVADMIRHAERPVLLIGGGVDRHTALKYSEQLSRLRVPIMTTWNGADRADSRWPNYFGRTNTWGMRYSNVLIQQADLVVALGTRLGLQQTGFNWQEYVPIGKVVQVEIDEAELQKGHPRVDVPIQADANVLLANLVGNDLGEHVEWLDFCAKVRDLLPLKDPQNVTAPGYVDPFDFALQLSELSRDNDLVIPCSSGGAYTTMMMTFQQRLGQVFISDKASASMGYGLSLAIGTAVAHPERRTILTEGDGGFMQNLQELATVAVNKLNMKIFIYENDGYASIRATQRNYFGGAYLGCNVRTGLGAPDWLKLFDTYGIPVMQLDDRGMRTPEAREAMESTGPQAFIVPIDPEQTYFPRIASRVTSTGSMESSPLHLMSPELPADLGAEVMPYLQPARASN